MIPQTSKLSNLFLGSTLIFSAQGGRGKEKNCKPAEKNAVESEGEAERGCGGNSASPEPKRSPAALLVQSRVQQKSFLFLLKETIGRAQIKKCEENFFAGWRALASGDGASKFAVRIFVKKSSDFNQKVPPIFRIRILGDFCLAPPEAGLGFGKDFKRIFEIAKQFLPAQTEVRRAKHG